MKERTMFRFVNKIMVSLLLVVLVALVVAISPVSAAPPGQTAEPEIQFTAELIGAVAGVVISLVFNYFPVLRVKFAALTQETKSLVMIGLMILVVTAVTILDYFDVINAGLTFDKAGITRIVFTLLAALVANQSTYLVSPQTRDVREAKIGPLERYVG